MSQEMFCVSGNHQMEVTALYGRIYSYNLTLTQKKLSFEEMVKELASFALYGTGVEIVL